MESSEYIRPPGTYYDIMAHPVDRKQAIEVAIVQDHRFAFFYWGRLRERAKSYAKALANDILR